MFQLGLCVFLLLASAASHSEIYQWKDENGKIHFDENNKGKKDEAVAVDVRDKYSIPSVESLTPIPYGEATEHRQIRLTNIKLTLPYADTEKIRIGRVICGKAIDIYWDKGVVDMQGHVAVDSSIQTFNEFGFKVGNGIGHAAPPTSLSLQADIIDLKMNLCPSGELATEISQNATYLRIRWTVTDLFTGKVLFEGESRGAHDALSARAVPKGTEQSFARALAQATHNLLADPAFAKTLVPVDIAQVATHFDEKITVTVQYGSGAGTFKDKTKTLMGNTAIVKTKTGFGSGIIINNDGYLLTNAHVVGDETRFTVVIGNTVRDAELVRKEAVRDVALIKMDKGFENFTGVEVARDRPAVGDEIFVIGAPLAVENSQTTTKGIISAVREMQGLRYFQTDAAINHGSSGGPVFNERGELIALTVAGMLTRDGAGLGINYLIPIEDVFSFLKLDNAINQNSLLATAGELMDKLSSSATADNNANSQVNSKPGYTSVLTYIFNWLNSPLVPSLSSLKTKTADFAAPDDGESHEFELVEKQREKFAKKARLDEAYVRLLPLCSAIAQYHRTKNRWPFDIEEMGMTEGSLLAKHLITSVKLGAGGAIFVDLAAVTFGEQQTMDLKAVVSNEGRVSWTCKSSVGDEFRGNTCKE